MITTPQKQQQQQTMMLVEEVLTKSTKRVESTSSLYTESTFCSSTTKTLGDDSNDDDHSSSRSDLGLDDFSSSSSSNTSQQHQEEDEEEEAATTSESNNIDTTNAETINVDISSFNNDATTSNKTITATSNNNHHGVTTTNAVFDDANTTEYHLLLERHTTSASSSTTPSLLPAVCCESIPRDSTSTTASSVPRKSCIKDTTSYESIPLRNYGWKNLPKLTHYNNIQSKFIVTESKKVNNTTATTRKSSSNVVQFGTIEIRSYDLCIGDNPSVSYGTPISLDWNYIIEYNTTIDSYESIRSLTKRRSMKQMMMNYHYRHNILLLHWNVTEQQLQQTEKEMNIIRSQRNMTRTLLPFYHIEDCITSLGRKIQRRRTKSVKNGVETPLLPPVVVRNGTNSSTTHCRKLKHARNSIVTESLISAEVTI